MSLSIPLAGLGLVIGASLAWAGLDALRKALTQRAEALTVATLVFGVQGALLGTYLALSGGLGLPDAGYLAPGAILLAMGMLSNWLFVKALAAGDLSRTIPLLTLTPVITGIAAIPILGEVPSPLQWGGIVVVVLGALLLNAKDLGVIRGLLRAPGAPLMAAVALLWAVASPVDKRALDFASPELHGALNSLGIGCGLALILGAQGRGRELGKIAIHPGLFMAAGATGALAFLLQLTSYTLCPVSLVEAIKRVIGLLSAVALGRLIFGEEITGRTLFSVALMGVGVALLLL